MGGQDGSSSRSHQVDFKNGGHRREVWKQIKEYLDEAAGNHTSSSSSSTQENQKKTKVQQSNAGAGAANNLSGPCDSPEKLRELLFTIADLAGSETSGTGGGSRVSKSHFDCVPALFGQVRQTESVLVDRFFKEVLPRVCEMAKVFPGQFPEPVLLLVNRIAFSIYFNGGERVVNCVVMNKTDIRVYYYGGDAVLVYNGGQSQYNN